MMNQEIKARWLIDLRSGDYQQTKGTLCDKAGYCCFGVLLKGLGHDLLSGEQVKNVTNRDADFPHLTLLLELGIDPQVQGWFLSTRNDGAKNSNVNPDREKWDFNQIADWIESNL